MNELCLTHGANINTSWLQEVYSGNELRLDGRNHTQKRQIEYQIITAFKEHVVVKVKLGYTTVVCSLSAKETRPYPDRPEEGFFRVTLQKNVFSKNENDQHTRKWVHIMRIIEEIEYLDRKKRTLLCIAQGSLVWSIEASMTILNDDGSVIDALFASLIFAFKSFPLFDKCSIIMPRLCVSSFAINIKDSKFLVDPTLTEEQLTGSNILTICVDLDRNVCTNIYYSCSKGSADISNDISHILSQCLESTIK